MSLSGKERKKRPSFLIHFYSARKKATKTRKVEMAGGKKFGAIRASARFFFSVPPSSIFCDHSHGRGRSWDRLRLLHLLAQRKVKLVLACPTVRREGVRVFKSKVTLKMRHLFLLSSSPGNRLASLRFHFILNFFASKFSDRSNFFFLRAVKLFWPLWSFASKDLPWLWKP